MSAIIYIQKNFTFNLVNKLYNTVTHKKNFLVVISLFNTIYHDKQSVRIVLLLDFVIQNFFHNILISKLPNIVLQAQINHKNELKTC